MLLLFPNSAHALVTRLTPLRDVLASEPFIFIAKIERIDANKPGAVLHIVENLKSKVAFASLSVDLKGDTQAQKDDQTGKLLKRLPRGQQVVVFLHQRGERFTAFVYSNGTWFQLAGQYESPATLKWQFTHLEPYLRRTFKGSTAELVQVVRDGLSGAKPPPEPNADEPPGLGPEIEPGPAQYEKPFNSDRPPQLAVIPTLVIIGPLAMLAALFPGLAAGLARLGRRWTAFFSIAALTSTLYLTHAWFANYLPEALRLSSSLWWLLFAVSMAGLLWSIRLHKSNKDIEAAISLPPARGERIVLGILSLFGLALVPIGLEKGILSRSPWKEFTVVWMMAAAGWAYALWLTSRASDHVGLKRYPALESVMILAQTLAYAGAAATAIPYFRTQAVQVVWEFSPKEPGAIISSPRVAGDRVYVATAQGTGFSTYGALYCLDVASGRELWKFDDHGEMKQVYCTPWVAGSRVFVGEGLHEDAGCKFYCLDALTGEKLWQMQTPSHIESNPCVSEDAVFFGAGDDGVYCCDASTGEVRWHFQDSVHVDAGPIVVDSKLYVGSGVSRTFKKTAVYCLDTRDGSVLWQQPVDLPVWSSPAVEGAHLFIGLGNGKLDHSAQYPERPAGALLCMHRNTGETLWRYDLDDAVMSQPALDVSSLYIGSRNHHFYCLDRSNGLERWRTDLGSPVVTDPIIVRNGSVYAVASESGLICMDAKLGTQLWSFDVGKHSQAEPQLFSSPVVINLPQSSRIVLGAGLRGALLTRAALYCVQE